MNRFFFALRRGAPILLSLALVFGLAACAEGDSESSAGGASAVASTEASAGADGGGTATVDGGSVEVTAADLEFSVDTITATAGEAFTVSFTNSEGVPHNFSVYAEEGGDEIAVGNVVSEGETDEVSIDALEPGEYFFVCDVHPQEMTGTIVVEG